MYLDETGQVAFSDVIELLINEIAKEKHHEVTTNKDKSKFWTYFADNISSYPLAAFHNSYKEFCDNMFYNELVARDLFDYCATLTIQMRSKPFTQQALETSLSGLISLKTEKNVNAVLDKDYSQLDAIGELLLFIRIFNRPIERRLLEISGGQIRLPPKEAEG